MNVIIKMLINENRKISPPGICGICKKYCTPWVYSQDIDEHICNDCFHKVSKIRAPKEKKKRYLKTFSEITMEDGENCRNLYPIKNGVVMITNTEKCYFIDENGIVRYIKFQEN